MGPGPVWMGVENLTPHQDSITRPSSLYQVALPTELSRPTFCDRTIYISSYACFAVNLLFEISRYWQMMYCGEMHGQLCVSVGAVIFGIWPLHNKHLLYV